jgi:hypothetical protein
MPQQVVELLASWKAGLVDAWRMVPLCLMWCIWGKHNARHFEDCERMVIELKAMMFKTLYE